jgi:hypothetical protein
MKSKFLTALLLFSIVVSKSSSAQDLSGSWRGNYSATGSLIPPTKLILELFRVNDSTYTGASHLYYQKGKYEHYKVNARYDKATGTVTVSEDSVLGYKVGFGVVRSTGTYHLETRPASPGINLRGQWKSHKRMLFRFVSVNVMFTKLDDAPAPTAATSPATATKPAQKDTALLRATDLQSLIEIDPRKADTLRLDLYDNGTIDNDSVSLYLDDTRLLSRQRISSEKIQILLPVSSLSPISKLKLIAESLGSIPPCTALLVITIGKNRYEVNLSSNFNKNGVVEFVLRE